MKKRVAIVISGAPGSGSTTLARNVANYFGWPLPYYAGGAIRWLAVWWEAHKTEGKDPDPRDVIRSMEEGVVPEVPRIHALYRDFPYKLDRLVDDIQKELLRTKDIGVHEGRLAPILSLQLEKESDVSDKEFIRIGAIVDPKVGAERQERRSENTGKTIEQLIGESSVRTGEERARYKELYGIEDYTSSEYVDGEIDTSYVSKEEALAKALLIIRKKFPDIDSFRRVS